jgi:hypothetical protein
VEALDIAPLMVWAAVVLTLLNLGTNLWAIMNSGTKKNEARIVALTAQQAGQDRRVASLEQMVQAMPAKDDMHQLQISLTSMAGDMRELRAVIRGNNDVMVRLETIVTRHEDHLLSGGGRK